MNIVFSWAVVLFGVMIILGFFTALALFLRKDNQLSNRILAIFLVTTSLWLVDAFFTASGIYAQNPDAYFKPIYYSLAFGPLIYFYVRSLCSPNFKVNAKHLLHFIPAMIQAGLYLFLFFQTYEFKRWYWLEIHQPYTYRIEFDGTFISMAIYLGFSLVIILKYQKYLKEHFSESSKITLNWLKVILSILFLLCFQWFIEVILRDFYHNYYEYNYSTLILGILTLILAFKAITQANLIAVDFMVNEEAEIKTTDIDQDVVKKIISRMEKHQHFLNPTLSLKEFAQLANLPARTISEHINAGLNKTFHDFVNEYRVEAVKEKLLSEDREKFTLEAIAYDCGFNSKATFNRIFKKYTGVSPGKYMG